MHSPNVSTKSAREIILKVPWEKIFSEQKEKPISTLKETASPGGPPMPFLPRISGA